MERIAIRQLRNDTSGVVRRVRAGERLIITIDGVPAAQLVPLDDTPREVTIDELVATGRILPPRQRGRLAPARPVRLPHGPSVTELLDELRDE
jgi:prevent-host-death family protein